MEAFYITDEFLMLVFLEIFYVFVFHFIPIVCYVVGYFVAKTKRTTMDWYKAGTFFLIFVDLGMLVNIHKYQNNIPTFEELLCLVTSFLLIAMFFFALKRKANSRKP